MRRAIVVGRAQGALDEYDEVCAMLAPLEFDDVLVVGRTAVSFPHRVDHLVTFHTMLVDRWCQERASNGYPPPREFWSSYHKGKPLRQTALSARADKFRYVSAEGGSSGRIALHVALEGLQADRVVLVGIPMTQEAGHFDQPGDWKEADLYWDAWAEDTIVYADRVRSASGRTRGAFGAPTREWLAGE